MGFDGVFMRPPPPFSFAHLFTAALLGLSVSACNPNGTFQGQLRDGLSDAPQQGVRIIARGIGSGDPSCGVREATTDSEGTFVISDTCPKTFYNIETTQNTLFLSGNKPIVGGEVATQIVKVSLWRAPTDGNIAILNGDELIPLRSFSDVETDTVAGTDIQVRYPSKKPLRVPTVGVGKFLVISGKETMERIQLLPLIPDSEARKFEGDLTIRDHVWIGTQFVSDTEVESVEAEINSERKKEAADAKGKRMARYLSHNAVPAGRYALLSKTDSRTYVIDFEE